MLVVSRWIKGYLVWLSQKSLFHVVATIQHWMREIWYSCTEFNTILKWIGSMCFVITCSRPRGSRILGFHMWFWCLNHWILWYWCRGWARGVNWTIEPYLQPKSAQNGLIKVGNGWTTAGAVVGRAHDHEADPSGANQEEEPTAGPMDLIPYNSSEDRGLVYSHFERMVLNQLHELNVSQHEHHNYCNERFNALDGQIHDIHDMFHSFQTRNDPQYDWVWWLFRIMHCILVFVIFQFEYCLFQLVVFHFSRLYQLYASIFYFQFLLVVFPSSIYKMKCNACYLYAFVMFDESKGGETLENG